MSGCCDNGCSVDALRERQRGTLQIVLGINAVMFVVIATENGVREQLTLI